MRFLASSPRFIAGALGIGCLSAAAAAADFPPSGTTEQISVSSTGAFANAFSTSSYSGKKVSADGRFVVFTSPASNLVWLPGGTGPYQVYVRDRLSGTTRLVSTTPSGSPASLGVLGSSANISANGRYVAFASMSPDLVRRDNNGKVDVFRTDLLTDRTIRVSLTSTGGEANDGTNGEITISDDGSRIAFPSTATNLVPGATTYATRVYVRDIPAHATILASVQSDGSPVAFASTTAIISGNGKRVLFYGQLQSSGNYTSIVRDLADQVTINAGVSASGAAVAERCDACDISRDGTRVLFGSPSANLVAGDANGANDLFLRDLTAATTVRVNLGQGGVQANGDTHSLGSLSADGSTVAFGSSATNLVPNDTNGQDDIFVRNIATGAILRASVRTDGTQASGSSFGPTLSADGSVVIFGSYDNTLGGNTSSAFGSQVYGHQMTAPGFPQDPRCNG